MGLRIHSICGRICIPLVCHQTDRAIEMTWKDYEALRVMEDDINMAFADNTDLEESMAHGAPPQGEEGHNISHK